MQKTAKNISLSIAGVMVAVPAGADIASIDYVQRWVQNQSPIPAGSVITGYASGSYGSYLLAGSTVGGPYSGVSISDIGSQMSPYINIKSLGNGYSGYDGVLTAGGWNSYSYFGTQIGPYLEGTQLKFSAMPSGTSYDDIVTYTGTGYLRRVSNYDFLSYLGAVLGSRITGINGNNILYSNNDGVLSGSGSVWLVGGTGASSGNGLLSASKLGSAIAGYRSATGSIGYTTVMVGNGTTVAPVYQSTYDFIKNTMAPYSYLFAMPGVSGGFVSTYISMYGSYIGGYQSGGSAAITKILGFTGTGSSIGSETAKWFDVSGLGSYIKGSQIKGFEIVDDSATGSLYIMGGVNNDWTNTAPGIMSGGHFGSLVAPYLHSYLKGSQISGYDSVYSGTGNFMVMAGWDGGGNFTGAKPGWVGAYLFGSYISPYLSGLLGNRITGYGTANSAYYVLGASNTSGSASWVKVSGGGLSNNLFIGSGSTSGAPTHILGSPTGGTGNVPGYYSVSKMGTVIGTVNGSQVKIEQTATAETLQANTGTIYFPVVQNGKIYGVTLNDFYILMNAQF